MKRYGSGLLHVLGILAMCATSSMGAQLTVDEAPEPGGGSVTTYDVLGTMFTFTVSGETPPCMVGSTTVTQCQFLNLSGQDWSSVRVTIDPGLEPVTCAALFGFTNCVRQQGNAVIPTVLTFSGGTGVPAGQLLYFEGFGWPDPTTFDVVANPGIPEPGSVALVVSGLAVAVATRRRWLRGQAAHTIH